ncbi:hypothetical protein GW17_00061480, partial [Ensete ventricosum]
RTIRKFARRFAKGIEKLAGNAKEDLQEEDRRTCRKITGGCRSMWETRATASRSAGKPSVSDGWTTHTTNYGQRPTADDE